MIHLLWMELVCDLNNYSLGGEGVLIAATATRESTRGKSIVMLRKWYGEKHINKFHALSP